MTLGFELGHWKGGLEWALDITYVELLARNDLASLPADEDYDPIDQGPKAIFSFSAVFAEVHVRTNGESRAKENRRRRLG